MRLFPSITGFLIALAVPAQAQDDPRIQTVRYSPGVVHNLKVVPGYVVAIVLGKDERVQTIAIGNSADWEAEAAKSGDLVFVKPLVMGARTNLQVVTSVRHYSFLLSSTYDGDPEAMFELHFDYEGEPESAPVKHAGPEEAGQEAPLPASYRIRGDRRARPSPSPMTEQAQPLSSPRTRTCRLYTPSTRTGARPWSHCERTARNGSSTGSGRNM